MLFYLALYIGFSLFYFKKDQTPYVPIYLFFGIAVLIAGFRDMIGGYDVYIYGEIYESNLFNKANKIFEPGFVFYYWILKLFNESREWMFLASSVLVLGVHFFVIKKLSPLIYVSLFIYVAKFYLMSFVYIRQGLAMALAWLAFLYWQRQRKKWVWILCIAAVFMHKSAIVIIPFFLIANRSFSLIQIFGAAIVTLVLTLSPFGSFFLETFAENVDNRKLTIYADKSGGINLFYLLEGVLIILLVLKSRAKLYVDRKARWILNGLALYGLIILLSLANGTFIRFAWYYFIFVVIGLPYLLLNTFDLKKRKLFKMAIFIYYTAVFFRLMLVYDGGDFIPYKSIFQDFDRNGRWEFMEYR